MNITVLCTSPSHPVNTVLTRWVETQRFGAAQIVRRAADAKGGDFLFLISCNEMVKADTRARYRHTLVVHASDLPQGKGWSPLVWGVIEGRHEFTISLLEAGEKVDSGDIWAKRKITFEGHELFDEINAVLFSTEIDLMNFAIVHEKNIRPQKQAGEAMRHYPRRTPADSRIDPNKSLGEQFDLLRVSDAERFPAFLELRGHRYEILLRKAEKKG